MSNHKQVGRTITIPGFIHSKMDIFTGKLGYHFMSFRDMEAYGYTFVTTHNLEFQLPDDYDDLARKRQAAEQEVRDLNKQFALGLERAKAKLEELKRQEQEQFARDDNTLARLAETGGDLL